MTKDFLRTASALAIAALVTGILASIVQTQVNLAAIAPLGAPVTAMMRWAVTIEDVARFAPVMMVITVAAFVPAFLAGGIAANRIGAPWRSIVLGGSGGVGLWVAFAAMPFVTPMPALVAATRATAGLAMICATGIVGGLVYARLTRPTVLQDVPPHAALLAGAITVPVISFVVMMPKPAVPVAHVDPAVYVVQTVASGLDRPWSVAILPDGRRLVTELGGRLRIIAADGTAVAAATDALPPIFHHVGAGLMDVVPDPDFERNAMLYLTMTYGDARANGTRLVRARLVGDRLANVRILFDSTAKTSDSNDGGRAAFLRDGTLILTLGDANDRREQAQNPANSFGKLIRLDRDGRAPRDNPLLHTPGAMAQIYSIGHRNVQGVAVDPADGTLLISDHGPRGGDEIAEIRAGDNHGWPVVTGGIDYSFARVTPFRRLPGFAAPTVDWTPSIAPAGLAVYDGALFAGWRGYLLVPALKERAIRLVERDGHRVVGQRLLLAERGERMRDVKVAPDGSIYVLTDGPDAALLRLVPARSRRRHDDQSSSNAMSGSPFAIAAR